MRNANFHPYPCTSPRGLAQRHKQNLYDCPKTTCALLVFGHARIIPRTSVLSRISAQIRNSGWFGCHFARFPTWSSKPHGCLCVCVLGVLGTKKCSKVKTILEIVTLSQPWHQTLQTFRALHCCRLGCCLLKKLEILESRTRDWKKCDFIEVLIHTPANGVNCAGPGAGIQ